jgi:Domain of unknown function (DUF4190)
MPGSTGPVMVDTLAPQTADDGDALMTQPGQPSPWSDPTAVDPYAAQPVSPYAPQPSEQPQPAAQPYAAQPHPAQPYAAQPYAAQPYPAQPYAAQPYPYAPAAGYEVPAAAQPYPTAYPPYGYPVAVAEPTNGLSIAALVVSIIGAVGLCFYGLGGYLGIVGAILGHVATRQIRERGGQGAGMAKAGVIVGWIATAIAVLATIALVIFFVWLSKQPTSTYE